MQDRSQDRAALVLLLLFLFGVVAWQALHMASTGTKPALVIQNLALGFFALLHALRLLGRARALALFGLTVGLSWIAESLSIATCLATCYTYTPVLGPRLGQVPLVVPIGWFAMIYFSYVIVNLMAEGQPVSTRGSGAWIAGLSILTAFVMTTWDLTLDPYMVGREGAWVWAQGGPYFGIPFANYVSWVETVFIIVVVYRLVERSLPPPPEAHPSRLFMALPVLAYALVGLPDVVVGYPVATRVLSPFTMGIPILAALGKVFQLPSSQAEVRQ